MKKSDYVAELQQINKDLKTENDSVWEMLATGAVRNLRMAEINTSLISVLKRIIDEQPEYDEMVTMVDKALEILEK
jgi:hypothetical protein